MSGMRLVVSQRTLLQLLCARFYSVNSPLLCLHQGVLTIIKLLLSAGADKRIVWEFELQQVAQFSTERRPILQTSGFMFPHEVSSCTRHTCCSSVL